MWLENQNYKLTRIDLLAITGLYDVDYRIVAACRNGTLCNIKRGWNEAKVIALLESQVRIHLKLNLVNLDLVKYSI